MNQDDILSLDYTAFRNYLTGLALMEIGRGIPFQDVLNIVMQWVLLWSEKNPRD